MIKRFESLITLLITVALLAVIIPRLIERCSGNTRAIKTPSADSRPELTAKPKRSTPEKNDEQFAFKLFALFFVIGLGILFKERNVWLDFNKWLYAPAASPPAWDLLDCLKPVVLLFFLHLLLARSGFPQTTLLPLSLGVEVIVFLYVILILAAKGATLAGQGISVGLVQKRWWQGARAWLAFFPCFLLLLALNVALLSVIYQVVNGAPLTEIPQQDAIEMLLDPAMNKLFRWIFFTFIFIGAPVIEETFFRGLLYGALKRIIPWQGAVCVSGLAFGLVHNDMFRFLPLAAFGILLAVLRERTNSLSIPIIIHMLHNGFMLALALSLFPA